MKTTRTLQVLEKNPSISPVKVVKFVCQPLHSAMRGVEDEKRMLFESI